MITWLGDYEPSVINGHLGASIESTPNGSACSRFLLYTRQNIKKSKLTVSSLTLNIYGIGRQIVDWILLSLTSEHA